MTRSERREHCFRILFTIEFCERDEFREQVELYFKEHKDIGPTKQKEILDLLMNLSDHLETIDQEISKHSESWNLGRLGKAELSILRLATYEITLDDDIPTNVAINEAIRLSDTYCNDKATPFIHGILSKIG